MANFTVVYDACLFYPAPLRDLMVRLAQTRRFRAPWTLGILTCAAPYVPALGQPRAGDLLQARIRRVVAIARAFGYSALVLGAWGCGAFHNDPERTAGDFRTALDEQAGGFAEVVFAISDW